MVLAFVGQPHVGEHDVIGPESAFTRESQTSRSDSVVNFGAGGTIWAATSRALQLLGDGHHNPRASMRLLRACTKSTLRRRYST